MVGVQSSSTGVTVEVKLMERMGRIAARGLLNLKLRGCEKAGYCAKSTKGSIVIDNPHLWWPWTMNEEAGYLYVLQVRYCGCVCVCVCVGGCVCGGVSGCVGVDVEVCRCGG